MRALRRGDASELEAEALRKGVNGNYSLGLSFLHVFDLFIWVSAAACSSAYWLEKWNLTWCYNNYIYGRATGSGRMYRWYSWEELLQNRRILQLIVGLQMERGASRSVTNAGVSLTRAAKVLHHSSTHLSQRQGCHKVARVAERRRILLLGDLTVYADWICGTVEIQLDPFTLYFLQFYLLAYLFTLFSINCIHCLIICYKSTLYETCFSCSCVETASL